MESRKFTVFGLIGVAGVLSACIFDSATTKRIAPPPGPLDSIIDVSVNTPYDSVTTAAPTLSIALFAPVHDKTLAPGSQSALTIALPVRVRQKETGRVVEYRYGERSFGTWTAERERELHLFFLRTFFFHPGVYDDTTAETLSLDSLYARAALFDHYTRRIDSAEAEEYRRQSRTTVRPKVLGIQVRVSDTEDTVYLDVVAPGSPAHTAGLRRGMSVLAVNDSNVVGDSALTRFVRFMALDTTSTKLTVGSPSGSLTQTITRDTANFPTVQVDSIGGAGYISIYSFTSTTIEGGSTASEFRKALAATAHFPSTILDLRDNGGGSLGVVLQMCDDLISGGVMIRLVERNFHNGASRRTETAYAARPGGAGEGRSFVILANEWSASASEIFIAALRSNRNTPFVGEHTYGKGVGQASFDTPGGGVAIVTYGTARTAEGTDYNGVGITPTHPSTAKPDAMLREAAAVAVPGALARRASSGLDRSDRNRASLMEWNRRQALRPDVVEWGKPVLDVKR
jgi:C-terminal peptidase prc